jgi:hypothetical protein
MSWHVVIDCESEDAAKDLVFELEEQAFIRSRVEER